MNEIIFENDEVIITYMGITGCDGGLLSGYTYIVFNKQTHEKKTIEFSDLLNEKPSLEEILKSYKLDQKVSEQLLKKE